MIFRVGGIVFLADEDGARSCLSRGAETTKEQGPHQHQGRDCLIGPIDRRTVAAFSTSSPRNLKECRAHTVDAILKMGRYMLTTSPPTTTPRKLMMKGSIKELMLSTALSTSSS